MTKATGEKKSTKSKQPIVKYYETRSTVRKTRSKKPIAPILATPCTSRESLFHTPSANTLLRSKKRSVSRKRVKPRALVFSSDEEDNIEDDSTSPIAKLLSADIVGENSGSSRIKSDFVKIESTSETTNTDNTHERLPEFSKSSIDTLNKFSSATGKLKKLNSSIIYVIETQSPTRNKNIVNNETEDNIDTPNMTSTFDLTKFSKLVPQYDGKEDELDRFIDCCSDRYASCTEDLGRSEFLSALRSKLTGRAYDFFKKSTYTDWDTLRTDLKKQFSSPENFAGFHLKLTSLKQGNNSVREYADKIEKILHSMNKTSSEIRIANQDGSAFFKAQNDKLGIKSFINGLKDSLRNVLRARKYTAIRDAISDAIELEIEDASRVGSEDTVWRPPARLTNKEYKFWKDLPDEPKYKLAYPPYNVAPDRQQFCSGCGRHGHSLSFCRERMQMPRYPRTNYQSSYGNARPNFGNNNNMSGWRSNNQNAYPNRNFNNTQGINNQYRNTNGYYNQNTNRSQNANHNGNQNGNQFGNQNASNVQNPSRNFNERQNANTNQNGFSGRDNRSQPDNQYGNRSQSNQNRVAFNQNSRNGSGVQMVNETKNELDQGQEINDLTLNFLLE